jgi:hypothetical protein
MKIIAFSTLEEIAPFAETWDRLARGVPLRSWARLSSWWRGSGSESSADSSKCLMVLGALDASGRLTGIAPWYLSRSPAKGWVLRWLGGGDVSSDHASILCLPEDADRVTESIAAYLTGPHCAPGGGHCWDILEIDGVDVHDSNVARLLRQLDERGCPRDEDSRSRRRNNLWPAGRSVKRWLNLTSQPSTSGTRYSGSAARPVDPLDAVRGRSQLSLKSLHLLPVS